MTLNSAIEWTDASWNPTSGCTKVSAGCKHCYAERMTKRLQSMGSPNTRDGFAPRTQPHMLAHPLTWKKPRRIFVNSMSDLFHPAIPLDYIKQVFAVMRQADWHQFQALTKRSARLLEWDDIPSGGQMSKRELLGCPTQKPLKWMDRIGHRVHPRGLCLTLSAAAEQPFLRRRK